MSKIKYRFNKNSLTFDKVQTTFKKRFLIFLSHFSTGLVFTGVMFLIAYNLIDSPKEKAMKRELAKLQLHYQMLNDQLDNFQLVLGDLQERDDNIYRIIFETDPIPSTIREAGIGGIDRYEKLKGFSNSELMIETQQKMDHIMGQLYVQSKSFDEVYALAVKKEEMLASLPAIQPVNNKELTRIGSYYGYRTDPFYKVRKFHQGIDFTAPTGTPVYATGNATVTKAMRTYGGYGKLIILDHGYNYLTYYAHLSRILVRPGQQVKRGELIGYIGSTGKSTAPHLHYEVHKNNRAVNPIYFFYNDITPEQFETMLTLSARPSQSMD